MVAWLWAYLARLLGPVGTHRNFPSHLQSTRRLLVKVKASLKVGPQRVRMVVAIALHSSWVVEDSSHPPVESQCGLVAVYVATRPASL